MKRSLAPLNGAPLAVTDEYAAGLQDLAEFEASGVELTEAEVTQRLGTFGTHAAGVIPGDGGLGAVGVISIVGSIGPASAGWYVSSTVERIGAEFDAMIRDERITAIVLNIDSPGGIVYGTPELAAKIAAGRQKKKVVAYTGGMMASAAYWLGSAAHEIVAAPSAQVGSIGVYTMHVDVSRMLLNDGVVVSLVKAGANKAEGSPFSPLSDADRAAMQARIDDYYDQFVSAVASHRGVTPAAVRAGYGAGRVLNARQALGEGLIDRLGTLEQVVAGLLGPSSRRTGARAEETPAAPVVAVSAAEPPTPLVLTLQVPSPSAAVVSSPTALAARSFPVPPESAAAATQAAIPDTREKDLRALAKEHNKDVAWLGAMVDSGKSVSTVQAEILAEYRDRGSESVVAGAGASVVRVGETRETRKPWGSFGEFLTAVHLYGLPGQAAERDPRLGALAAVTGMGQNTPADGGFLVAPQFSSLIWDKLNSAPDSLLARTDQYTITGESLTFNANAETSRATGSRYGGVRGYWLAEADQQTASKPKFRQVKIEPQELGVLVYITEKLLRNSAVALEQYVSRAAADEINFLVGDSIVNGTGVGQPKGFLAATCTIQVAKETSQAAATINQANISKMWARLHPRSRANAVWLHNVDIEPQLDALSTVVTNVAGTENVGGYANKVFDAERRTLKGRPLVACEYAATLGTVGDLILADMSGYLAGTRGAGIDSAMSMHVRFEYREQAFRFVFEVDGQPWLAAAQTPANGTNTLSTFVKLATRA